MTTTVHQLFDHKVNYLYNNITTIDAEVVFGDPGKKCSGHGICRVYVVAKVTGSARTCSCAHTVGQFHFDHNRHKLLLRLLRANISAATWEKHFSNDWFQVNDTWIAEADLTLALQLEALVVQPGTYPVVKKGKWVEVWF
ncbi:hypothetical protein [Haliscomenobacter sp.]|uniref:hypothetical protein n=1 Tax=Haliscomenobacter sp. TaxID=2717303 RepID=UPI003364C169